MSNINEVLKQDDTNKQTYTVEEIARILNISKRSAYELIRRNEIHSVRVGRSIRVSIKSFNEFLNK